MPRKSKPSFQISKKEKTTELGKKEETIEIIISHGGTQSKIELPAKLQAVNARGQIVNISTEKIKQKLTTVVTAIQTVSTFAMDAAQEILPGGPDGPLFDLTEITVGLNVSLEAGVVIAGMGAESSLELRFSRIGRGSSS